MDTVVNTRPEGQQTRLTELLQHAGFSVIECPTLQITPLAEPQAYTFVQQQSLNPNQIHSDWIIFTSQNAVHYGLDCLQASPQTRLIGIGPSTQQLIEQAGFQVALDAQLFTSETLLQQPVLQPVTGQTITIVRGVGGRRVLPQGLTDRGAEVNIVECYARTSPPELVRQVNHILEHDVLAVCVTSGEGLTNMLAAATPATQQFLYKIPLLVISVRIVTLARRLGFTGPVEVIDTVHLRHDEALVALAKTIQSEL